MVLAAIFAALTAVGALFRIPNPVSPEVPFTLQVFFVLLAGGLLRPLAAALSQIVYILLGALGVPVFAGGQAGIGVLVGPTGGYLFGFVAAALVVGLLVGARREVGYLPMFGSMIIGVIVIYAFGMVQLAAVLSLSLVGAFLAGVLTFIPFDLIKALIATLVALRLKKLDAF